MKEVGTQLSIGSKKPRQTSTGTQTPPEALKKDQEAQYVKVMREMRESRENALR